MSAHTPGPWFAAALRRHGANPKMDGCDIGAANGANVAIALHQDSDREPRETIANAHLIAAAPELLDALRWFEQFQNRHDENSHACFERVAETFHRETGYLSPGKAVNPHYGATQHQERSDAWNAWYSAGVERARAAIVKATGGSPT